MVGVVMGVASRAAPNREQILKGPIAPGLMLAYEVFQLIVVLAATAVMGRIEGRSAWSYGIAGPHPVRNLVWGWLGGFVFLSILAGGLYAGGYLVFDGIALGWPQAIGYGLVWFLGFLLVGMGEEIFNRGYLLATLARGMGFWPAAALSSAFFGASHLTNHGETAAGIAGVVVGGLIFCLLLRVSGSLWLGIGFHAAWDWSQSYLYGTPDSGMTIVGRLLVTHAAGDPRMSGGDAGPEGSLLAAPLFILGPLLLVWGLRRSGVFAGRRKPAG